MDQKIAVQMSICHTFSCKFMQVLFKYPEAELLIFIILVELHKKDCKTDVESKG